MHFIANRSILDYPKNTKEGILLSKYHKGYDGVMIDVRMTSDQKLILTKNELIKNKYYVSKMKYQDIKKIKIGKRINNYYIPLLEEILNNYQKEYLIIKLHHNYADNDILVNELKRILKNSLIKILILVDNDNLYEYLKMNNISAYNILSNQFINIYINKHNVNGKTIYWTNDNINIIKELNTINNEYFVITNDAKGLKELLINYN